MGAICATPPHLEGAPLLQIPIDSLNCDGPNDYENSEVLEQLDIISKQSNLSYSKELSNIVSHVHPPPEVYLKLIFKFTFCVDFSEECSSVRRLWHHFNVDRELAQRRIQM